MEHIAAISPIIKIKIDNELLVKDNCFHSNFK